MTWEHSAGRGRRICAIAWVVAAVALPSSPALADKQLALQRYEQGRKAYDLGRFQDAIGHFTAAYEAQPAPAFLFNIAQSHRQLGQCRRAIFFYRRFVTLKPDAPQRAEVEGRIAQLEATCPPPQPPAAAPEASTPPTGPPTAAPTGPQPTAAPPGAAADEAKSGPGAYVQLGVSAGVAVPSLGDGSPGLQPAFHLAADHPISLGAAELRVGVAATAVRIPFSTSSAWQTQALARAELAYRLASRLEIRAGAGAGVLIFSGLSEGNPFTEGGAGTSGPLSMLALQIDAGLDVVLLEDLRLRITPAALSYSPKKRGLHPSIDRLLRFDALLGLAYRM